MVGAIGYLEVVYARQNRLPAVHIRNRAGKFVSPMPFEIASAATSIDGDTTKRDLRVSLVNAPSPHAYPIVSFTWMLRNSMRTTVHDSGVKVGRSYQPDRGRGSTPG